MRKSLGVFAMMGLSACASVQPPTPITTATPSFRPAPVMPSGGLDSVIGAGAATLTARLGETRLDLVEGDARKLQFATETCVLDIYLYPTSAGAQPVATHVEARERSTGAAIDRARCLQEIEAR